MIRSNTSGFAVLLLFLLVGSAVAAPFQFARDSYYCPVDGFLYGDAVIGSAGNPGPFEIWEIGARVAEPSPGNYRLEFSILMDLPEAGFPFSDSYSQDENDKHNLAPGDLWITVGHRDPFRSGGPLHAVALTTRKDNADYDPAFGGNIVRQKYPGEVWPETTKGNLYKNALPATGTFETYQQAIKSQPPPPGLSQYPYGPDDKDGDDTRNGYFTLIKDYDEEVAGKSAVTWTLEPYWAWDEDLGDWVLTDSWRVIGWVDMTEIGLTPGMPYSLFVSSECGNDGAYYPPVPEAPTWALFLAGLAVARRRARR